MPTLASNPSDNVLSLVTYFMFAASREPELAALTPP